MTDHVIIFPLFRIAIKAIAVATARTVLPRDMAWAQVNGSFLKFVIIKF